MKTIILFCIFIICNSKGGGRASSGRGGGSGLSARGTTSAKTKYVRSSNNENSGYRSNAVLGGVAFWFWTRPNYNNQYDNTKKGLIFNKTNIENENTFICENGKEIISSKLCDNIDDCGDSTDEISPLPCKGKANNNELNLYIACIKFYGLWIFAIYIIYKCLPKDTSIESKFTFIANELAINYDKNDMDYLKLNTIFTAIVPSILFIISFIFYLVALTNNSKIIHFYICNFTMFSLFIVFSCCNGHKVNTIIIFILLIACSVSYTHYSNYFDTIPSGLLEIFNYNITSSISLVNVTNPIENIQLANNNKYFQYNFNNTMENKSYEFIISFENQKELAFIDIYPTFHNKTTDNFAIYGKLNNYSWFKIASGPMPYYKTPTYTSIMLDSEDIDGNIVYLPITELKFKLYPYNNCTNSCAIGLNAINIGGLKN